MITKVLVQTVLLSRTWPVESRMGDANRTDVMAPAEGRRARISREAILAHGRHAAVGRLYRERFVHSPARHGEAGRPCDALPPRPRGGAARRSPRRRPPSGSTPPDGSHPSTEPTRGGCGRSPLRTCLCANSLLSRENTGNFHENGRINSNEPSKALISGESRPNSLRHIAGNWIERSGISLGRTGNSAGPRRRRSSSAFATSTGSPAATPSRPCENSGWRGIPSDSWRC